MKPPREPVALSSVVRSDRSFPVCRCDIGAVGDDGRETLCGVAHGVAFPAPTDMTIVESMRPKRGAPAVRFGSGLA